MGMLIKNEFYKLKREWFMVFQKVALSFRAASHIVCPCSSRINLLTMKPLYRLPSADVSALYFALL